MKKRIKLMALMVAGSVLNFGCSPGATSTMYSGDKSNLPGWTFQVIGKVWNGDKRVPVWLITEDKTGKQYMVISETGPIPVTETK